MFTSLSILENVLLWFVQLFCLSAIKCNVLIRIEEINVYFYWGHAGEVFDYLVTHGRMKEKEARAKFRQVSVFI